MSLTIDLINKLAALKDLKNDNQIAKYLGIQAASVYRYRDGYTMDFPIARKVCKELGIDEGPVMAAIAAEREKDPFTRRSWEKIVKRLGGTAAAVALPFMFAAGIMGEVITRCILC